jgi:hypothetical protein
MKNNRILALALVTGLVLLAAMPLMQFWVRPRAGYWPAHMYGWSMPMLGGWMMWFGMLSMTLTVLGTLLLIGAAVAVIIRSSAAKSPSGEQTGFKA